MGESIIIVDHLRGHRRGRRHVFSMDTQVRFGRHPDSDVPFDAYRDLDASSQHAELFRDGTRYMLRDLGSSNGTLVNGCEIGEAEITPGQPIAVEFGAGGPVVRIFIGTRDAAPVPPPRPAPWRGSDIGLWPLLLVAVGIVFAAVVAWRWLV